MMKDEIINILKRKNIENLNYHYSKRGNSVIIEYKQIVFNISDFVNKNDNKNLSILIDSIFESISKLGDTDND